MNTIHKNIIVEVYIPTSFVGEFHRTEVGDNTLTLHGKKRGESYDT